METITETNLITRQHCRPREGIILEADQWRFFGICLKIWSSNLTSKSAIASYEWEVYDGGIQLHQDSPQSWVGVIIE